jgi:hypothetical protein
MPQGRPCGRPPAALRPGNETTVTGAPASPSMHVPRVFQDFAEMHGLGEKYDRTVQDSRNIRFPVELVRAGRHTWRSYCLISMTNSSAFFAAGLRKNQRSSRWRLLVDLSSLMSLYKSTIISNS